MLPVSIKAQVNSISHTVNSSNIKTQANSISHKVNPFHLIIQNHNTINYIRIGISIVLGISIIVSIVYVLKYIKLRHMINAK